MWGAQPSLAATTGEGFLFLSSKKVAESLGPQELYPEAPCSEKRHIPGLPGGAMFI